jgi:hypothetical protein
MMSMGGTVGFDGFCCFAVFGLLLLLNFFRFDNMAF